MPSAVLYLVGHAGAVLPEPQKLMVLPRFHTWPASAQLLQLQQGLYVASTV